jgi:competence protein ComEC
MFAKVGWKCTAILAGLALLAWASTRGLPDGRLHVYFLDVGQGDAILIRTPQGSKMLIDGGPSPAAVLSQLGDVLPFWDRTLDLVALTHPDGDHVTGLAAVAERFQIRLAVETAASSSDPAAIGWQKALAAKQVPKHHAVRGTSYSVGEVALDVLGPAEGTQSSDATGNNQSLVLRVRYGEGCMILTGDAELEEEAELLLRPDELRCEVLKIGHHGSRRSTGEAFLAAVAPKVVIIQVGSNNRFGHPHADLLARLANLQVMRTDRDGRVELTAGPSGHFEVAANR